MALSKRERQAVWNKSGGYCWYCGIELPKKGWHADHIEPIQRLTEAVPREERKNKYVFEVRQTGECHKPHLDHINNMVPACAPCNLFKGCFSVEQFRNEIAQQIDRARRSSVNFRTGERFGLIETNDNPVVFWFEKNALLDRGECVS
ncbi:MULTISPECIES: HNH endonuclease [Marinomonas]|uniref:HNH endonuclease n=1 Tax=Marinomonas rhodophyticola TaxID=2992803 RepID=A0ABT3KGF4_9GAMM|nr:HNH endonuclease signature motif containing protein [Marinomonas sp. KJ51-3]MCW4629628.1 HNH endonuclease [Marinomonas sp. KJ51-3]